MSEEVQTTQEPETVSTTQEPVEELKPSWVGENGELNREAFGELGEHSMFDKIKTVEDMAKSYINVEKLKGQKLEELIASEDPEIQSKLRDIRGVPESVDGYDFEIDIPEGVPVGESRIAQAKELFLEHKVPKEVAQKLLEWDINNANEALSAHRDAMKQAFDDSFKELKGEWKNKTDNNLEKAANTLSYLELDDLAEDVRNPQTPQALDFARKVFEKITPLIENDEIIQARQTQTVATAKDRMDDLRVKMQQLHGEGKSTSTEYKRLIDEMRTLTDKIS